MFDIWICKPSRKIFVNCFLLTALICVSPGHGYDVQAKNATIESLLANYTKTKVPLDSTLYEQDGEERDRERFRWVADLF